MKTLVPGIFFNPALACTFPNPEQTVIIMSVLREVSIVLMKPMRLLFSLSDWSMWSQEVCWSRSWSKGSTLFDQSARSICIRVAALKGQTETPPPSSMQKFTTFVHFYKTTPRIQLWVRSYNAIRSRNELLIAVFFCGLLSLRLKILGVSAEWSWSVHGSQVRKHHLMLV